MLVLELEALSHGASTKLDDGMALLNINIKKKNIHKPLLINASEKTRVQCTMESK